MTGRFWLERAWLGTTEGALSGVLVTVEDGRFTRVETGVERPPAAAHRLAGLTIPGLANCHSHAFHRALRGHTQRDEGTFWTWREQMYSVAERLTPESYYTLGRAVYREMVASGITSVGEFHYLHHAAGGARYSEPNAMGLALIEAARDAGLRITLLDTCYLTSGIGASAEGVQLRYSDRDAASWQQRVDDLAGSVASHGSSEAVVAAAVHSVRAVPRQQIREVAEWATSRGVPLHVHVSEQEAENEECLAAYGVTPTQLLSDAGALGSRTSAVHATHLTDDDLALLGSAGAFATLCPTTERDLGDGIGPARLLQVAGCQLTLGSDSHAVIDPFEEMRAIEMHERLLTRRRGHWSAPELLTAGTYDGHRSLGYPDAGRIVMGARADLVTLDVTTARTAGTGAGPQTAVFAAGNADVVSVVAGGRIVFEPGDRGDIGRELDRVVNDVWEDN